MPELHATRALDLPLEVIWPFIADLDHWAPMLKGYVAHEKQSQTRSIWTLTGELGPFSKTIQVQVTVTEWVDAQRVSFALEGIDENVQATGTLELSEEAPLLPPRGFWRRLLDWLLRRHALPVRSGKSHVTFRFAIEAGGPMGPMINAMLGPYAEAVVEELMEQVSQHLLGQHPVTKA